MLSFVFLGGRAERFPFWGPCGEGPGEWRGSPEKQIRVVRSHLSVQRQVAWIWQLGWRKSPWRGTQVACTGPCWVPHRRASRPCVLHGWLRPRWTRVPPTSPGRGFPGIGWLRAARPPCTTHPRSAACASSCGLSRSRAASSPGARRGHIWFPLLPRACNKTHGPLRTTCRLFSARSPFLSPLASP